MSHAHPLSDTEYYINHPDEYVKAMANRRRHEAHHAYNKPVYKPPPKPPQNQNVDVNNQGDDVMVSKDGAVYALGKDTVVASPL